MKKLFEIKSYHHVICLTLTLVSFTAHSNNYNCKIEITTIRNSGVKEVDIVSIRTKDETSCNESLKVLSQNVFPNEIKHKSAKLVKKEVNK